MTTFGCPAAGLSASYIERLHDARLARTQMRDASSRLAPHGSPSDFDAGISVALTPADAGEGRYADSKLLSLGFVSCHRK